MSRRVQQLGAVLGSVALLSLGGSLQASAQITQTGPVYRVTRVIDGDTIVIETGDQVRLIGIDTPEVAESGKPVQCWGDQATYYLASILEGRGVYLTYSPEARRDAFNRILAYVYRVDGNVDINRHLLETGYATNYFQFPHRRLSEFAGVALQARLGEKGIFGPECRGERLLRKPDLVLNPYEPARVALTDSPQLRLLPALNRTATYFEDEGR